MNCSRLPSDPTAMLQQELRCEARNQGFCGVGFTRAIVTDTDTRLFERWLDQGFQGPMEWIERHRELRRNLASVLPEAKTAVVLAADYSTELSPRLPIARYALFPDYHKMLKRMAKPLIAKLEAGGFVARICVDTAPVHERALALRAGLGFIGRNGCLIMPGVGSYLFLAVILTDAPFEPDRPCKSGCAECGKCLSACPTGALQPDGQVDCRRCLSALSIELRDGIAAVDLKGRFYGCDRCQEVCPHNCPQERTEKIKALEMKPLERILTLTRADILGMDATSYAHTFAGTAMKRVALERMKINAAQLPDEAVDGQGL